MVAGAYVARSHATCYATNPMPVNPPYRDNDQWTCPPNCPPPTVMPTGGANEGAALYSGKQLRFAIETSGRIVMPVTLFISFKHRPGGPSGFGPKSERIQVHGAMRLRRQGEQRRFLAEAAPSSSPGMAIRKTCQGHFHS